MFQNLSKNSINATFLLWFLAILKITGFGFSADNALIINVNEHGLFVLR